MPSLSFGQQRLWLSSEIDPGITAYNVPFTLEVDGPLSVGALETALRDVLTRHEVLRSRVVDGEAGPRAEVCQPEHFVLDRVVDASLDSVHRRIEGLISTPFDLRNDIPLRATIFEVGPERFVLSLVFHHIATDGSSTRIFCDELSQFYEDRITGRKRALVEPPLQYSDFASWQKELLGEAEAPTPMASRELSYWKKTLTDVAVGVDNSFDFSRPEALGTSGWLAIRELDPQTHRAFIHLARELEVSPFSAYAAAVVGFQQSMTHEHNVCLGFPVTGREDSDLEDVIGFFVNSVPLFAPGTQTQSVRERIVGTHAAVLDAMTNQHAPIDWIVRECGQSGAVINMHPLFQTMFTLQSDEERRSAAVTLKGCETRTRLVQTSDAKFDCSISITEQFNDGEPDGLTVYLNLNSSLFRASTAEVRADSLSAYLDGFAANPDAPMSNLTAIAPAQSRELESLETGGATQTPGSIWHQFDMQVQLHPSDPALSFESIDHSYSDLWRAAKNVASQLLNAGTRSADIVPLLLDRRPLLIASMLGVLHIGAAFTVINPDLPLPERQRLLRASSASVVVTDQAHKSDVERGSGGEPSVILVSAESVFKRQPEVGGSPDLVPHPSDANDLACVVFTSGSTGTPKGVLVPQRAILATIFEQEYSAFGPREIFLHCAPTSWDGMSLEVFGAILHGGKCVLLPNNRTDPLMVADLCRRENITMLQCSASLLNYLVDEHLDDVRQVRTVFTGGEPASPEHVRRLMDASDTRVVNGYGPAESFGFSTTYQCGAHDHGENSVPIGRPVRNKNVRVLDANLCRVPPSVVGEIFLSGDGLALGYLASAVESARKFVADPYGAPGSRMYRSGDLGRWRDGQLEFVGRRDTQMKIRGFRVEPDGIANLIRRECRVPRVAVVPFQRGASDQLLAVYYVGSRDIASHLREMCEKMLPEYMVPAAYVAMDELPIGPSGKLDTKSLPKPEVNSDASSVATASDARTNQIIEMFEEILGAAAIKPETNFFHAGGHSLLAARLANKLRARFKVQVDLVDVFKNPTPSRLASFVRTASPAVERPKLRRRSNLQES